MPLVHANRALDGAPVVDQSSKHRSAGATTKTASAAQDAQKTATRQSGARKTLISWEELKQHNTREDLWLAIEGKAYDVTEWKETHPGGWRLLQFYGGKDATEPFLAYHTGASKAIARAKAPGFYVGDMEHVEPTKQAVAFREMAAAVDAAGLHKFNEGWYNYLYAYLITTYVATWVLVCHGQIVLGACTMGMFWGQLAFLGHDLGHTCVHGSRRLSNCIAIATNAFLGIGISHWMDNHNAHHAVVNSSDNDPEVQFMPFIAPHVVHFEHNKKNQTRPQFWYGWMSKQLVSAQHLSFIPLLMVARYKFYIQSLGHWSTCKIYIHRWAELGAQLFFFAWFGLLTAQLPTWRQRLVWILLSHASDWVLYLQTVITHFPRDSSPGVKGDWIESQAVGTLNWSCHPWMDWFHGGLHFQIEHHLFPRMPRHSLRACSAYVRPVLKQLGIEYHSPTFFGAIMETYHSLRAVAMEARLPMGAKAE